MSENQLTAEQREDIRKQVNSILATFGGLAVLIFGGLGFILIDYFVSKAVSKADEENRKIVTNLITKSAEFKSNADKILEDLNKKKKEVESINTKMIALQKDAKSLSNNELFAKKVASFVHSEFTFKWEKINLKERTHGFKSSCLYVLRTNDYRNDDSHEKGKVYGPDFRRVYIGMSLAGAGSGPDYLADTIRYFDEEGKINKVRFMDLKIEEHGFGPNPAGKTIPKFTAYEACFAPYDVVYRPPVRFDESDGFINSPS
ncbi:MAG: hypothetical protein QNK36_20325 [Colwellia sp.]|nr:hypothetical protein [Colwellia sp.]